MTERESGDGRDYPDGSVGRYVRERWGAPQAAGSAERTPGPTSVEPRAGALPREPAGGGRPADPPPDAAQVTAGADPDVTVESPEPPGAVADDGYSVDREHGVGADVDPEDAGSRSAADVTPRTTLPDPSRRAVTRPTGGSPVGPLLGSSGGTVGADGAGSGAATGADGVGVPGPRSGPRSRPRRAQLRAEAETNPGVAPGTGADNPPPFGAPRFAPAPAEPGTGIPGAAGDTGPRDSSPRDPGSRDPGSRDTSPRDTSPRDTSPRDGAPRNAARRTEAGVEQALAPVRSEPADLSSARLLRSVKRPPQSGWRRLVYVLSGRTVNPGESPTDITRRELTARINQPLLGCYKIAMLSLKGGVGKTTMTATLGATFASLRGDRVVAVDANPDRGTLSQKIPLETSATVRHLLRDARRVRRYTDVRAYTSQGPSRLEVLASEQDPAVSEAFSEDDYRRTVDLLEHFYSIVLTDCGTGLMHSAMYGVLGMADQLIIVSSGSIDGARSASATMDWLDAHGHGDLVANAVAVINSVHRRSRTVDINRVEEHFAARCRAVVRVPFDAHLDEGAEIDLDRLEPGTRMALLSLAAAVADAFDRTPVR